MGFVELLGSRTLLSCLTSSSVDDAELLSLTPTDEEL